MFAPEADYERQGDVQDVVFPCGYTLQPMATQSIFTTAQPIPASLWLMAVSAACSTGSTLTAIRNIPTTGVTADS